MEKPYKKILDRALENARLQVEECLPNGNSTQFRGDTPIEKYFFDAIRLQIALGFCEFSTVFAPSKRKFFNNSDVFGFGESPLIIESQVQIGSRRVDFCIGFLRGIKHVRALVVECDGHDFHERTKDQAKRDRSVDRELQSLGLTVFRFTGSELWNDPVACADQVLDYCVSKYCL